MSKPDIDRPSTWKFYQKGMCNGCQGGCCTMPVEVRIDDLLRLGVVSVDEANSSLKKLSRQLIKKGIVQSYRQGTDLFMLAQKSNRDCIYLDSNRLCMVYDKRPDVCREFPNIGPRPGYCPQIKK